MKFIIFCSLLSICLKSNADQVNLIINHKIKTNMLAKTLTFVKLSLDLITRRQLLLSLLVGCSQVMLVILVSQIVLLKKSRLVSAHLV